MKYNTQEALDLLHRYTDTLAAFIEACDDLRNMDISERTRKSLIKKWEREMVDSPPDSCSYGRNFQDADSAIEKIFEP